MKYCIVLAITLCFGGVASKVTCVYVKFHGICISVFFPLPFITSRVFSIRYKRLFLKNLPK